MFHGYRGRANESGFRNLALASKLLVDEPEFLRGEHVFPDITVIIWRIDKDRTTAGFAGGSFHENRFR